MGIFPQETKGSIVPLGEVGWGVELLMGLPLSHSECPGWRPQPSPMRGGQPGAWQRRARTRGELTISGCSWAIIYRDSVLRASSRARAPCPNFGVFGTGVGMSTGGTKEAGAAEFYMASPWQGGLGWARFRAGTREAGVTQETSFM